MVIHSGLNKKTYKVIPNLFCCVFPPWNQIQKKKKTHNDFISTRTKLWKDDWVRVWV